MARTVSRWTRFLLKGSDAVLREIPVNSISGVSVNYEVVDISAWQDAAKGFLPNTPIVKITVTGPFSTDSAAAMAASGAAPTLSGSHTILSALYSVAPPQAAGPINLPLAICFGIGGYYTNAQPAFGLATGTATSGFWVSRYVVNPNDATYEADFDLFPGSTLPSWINAVLA